VGDSLDFPIIIMVFMVIFGIMVYNKGPHVLKSLIERNIRKTEQTPDIAWFSIICYFLFLSGTLFIP